MYRKDYILRLIEDFAKVLGVFLGLKLEGDFKQAQETLDEALKKFTETDVSFLLSLNEEMLIPELAEKRKLDEDQLHIIAELLYQQGDLIQRQGTGGDAFACYKRSLTLFKWLNEHQRKTFSVEIAQRLDLLQSIVQS